MSDAFVDYYELLQISPNAEPQTVVRVFRMLAARYHPDNAETGSMDTFLQLMEANKVLTDPVRRANYDIRWQSERARPMGVFGRKEFIGGLNGEANRRLGLLTLLYASRRTNPDHPGCSLLDLERSMATPREHLAFTLWYLKDKGLLAQDECSDFVITHLGVDFVEDKLPTNETLHRLLNAAEEGVSRSTSEFPWPVSPVSTDGEEAHFERPSVCGNGFEVQTPEDTPEY